MHAPRSLYILGCCRRIAVARRIHLEMLAWGISVTPGLEGRVAGSGAGTALVLTQRLDYVRYNKIVIP